jgi:FtsP/CotA-like multicopper oxidase with cupredoxin domain
VSATGTESICTRAPTHEPYPYHNQGVQVDVNLSDGTNSVPPGAPDLPQGVSITKTA